MKYCWGKTSWRSYGGYSKFCNYCYKKMHHEELVLNDGTRKKLGMGAYETKADGDPKRRKVVEAQLADTEVAKVRLDDGTTAEAAFSSDQLCVMQAVLEGAKFMQNEEKVPLKEQLGALMARVNRR